MNNIEHKKNMLINIYNFDKKEVEKLNNSEINKLLLQKEKEQIAISKNPNKFWFIKEMPPPKQFQTKTSKTYGFLVILTLFLVLIGFLIMFIVLAFLNN